MPYFCQHCREQNAAASTVNHLACSSDRCECRCHYDFEFRRHRRRLLENRLPPEEVAARHDNRPPPTPLPVQEPERDPYRLDWRLVGWGLAATAASVLSWWLGHGSGLCGH